MFRWTGGSNRAATSFSDTELAALDQLFKLLFRQADVRVVVRQLREPLGAVAVRVARMRHEILTRATAENGVDVPLDEEHTQV